MPWLAAVVSSSRKPVSAKQNLSSPRSRSLTIFCQLLGFVLLFLPSCLRAESLEDAAHELAMKVCAMAHKQQVRVHWLESAESPGYLSDPRKRIFLDQISACGMDPVDSPDAPAIPAINVAVRVTASRVLLIADATDAAGGRQVYMIEIPRTSLFVSRETSPTPQLQKELLWQQEKPIQSALEWQNPDTHERFLFLLSESLFMRFDFENGAWKWMDSAQFLPVGRRPQTGEASLFYSHAKGRVELALRKKVCDLDLTMNFGYTCTGTEAGDRTAELASTCEESPRYLATGKGDFTQPDRITLTSALGAGTAASADESYGASMDMPGPVLDISVAENSKSASAVVKNLSTGDYEVYRITSVCSN